MIEIDGITVSRLADRPGLVDRIWEFPDTWPEFMNHNLVGGALMGRVVHDHPEFCVVATAGDRVVARGVSVPFNAELDGRHELPDQGWDRVQVWAFKDRAAGRRTTVASALEIAIDQNQLGRGLSHRMLAAMRQAVADQGHSALVAPVRPTAKHEHPHVSMAQYVRQTRQDGLPVDPWLRVHVKAGGTIEKIAPASMSLGGSLAEWRAWTGLPFDRDGDVDVPGALVPVHCDITHGYAAYIEPNVWIRHAL